MLQYVQQCYVVCVCLFTRIWCDGDNVEVPTTAIHPSIHPLLGTLTHVHTHTLRPYGYLIPTACLHCDLAQQVASALEEFSLYLKRWSEK